MPDKRGLKLNPAISLPRCENTLAGLCFGGMNALTAVNEQCVEIGLAELRIFVEKGHCLPKKDTVP